MGVEISCIRVGQFTRTDLDSELRAIVREEVLYTEHVTIWLGEMNTTGVKLARQRGFYHY